MLRTLLATTALAALSTSAVFAQDAQPVQQDDARLQSEAQQTGAGQQVQVNSGDTIVIQPDQSGAFTLNFQFGQTDEMAGQGVGGMAGQTRTDIGWQQDLQPQEPEQLSTDTVIGSDVYGANDENIGNVTDVILTEDGEVDALIVDVGGFLGLGAHQMAIGLDNLQFMTDANQTWYVFTPFTQDELEAQPEYDEETYVDQRQDQRLTAQPPAQ
ncbi:PRC-barrel domain-containing protein [Pelagibacterium montanilacus]|uniref:PRC-barrel domain-containing protein n=1 Tax=Pelagibacterium montanilacus TaxID=2185280 RepID=UPI0013DF3274|nr:PRC-barrel domain-containing protein [Pelagibacterium montanilacus]